MPENEKKKPAPKPKKEAKAPAPKMDKALLKKLIGAV